MCRHQIISNAADAIVHRENGLQRSSDVEVNHPVGLRDQKYIKPLQPCVLAYRSRYGTQSRFISNADTIVHNDLTHRRIDDVNMVNPGHE